VALVTATKTAPVESEAGLNITRVVKVMMALNGMDQQTLAAHIGKDATSITKIFRGQRRWAIDDLVKMAEVFDCPPGLFFEPVDQLVRNR